MNQNLYALFESRFPADRESPLLILPDESVVTYGQADEGAARYAALLAGLGLRPGDRVAVQVEKSPEALLLYLGCLRAGLAYLPLNSAYQEGEIGYFLENAEPGAIVAQPRSMPWLQPLAARLGIRHVFSLDEHGQGSARDAARSAPTRFGTVERGGDDLAAILYTSGTTGRSKGAMLSHRNLASNAEVLHRFWGFRPGDVLVHMLPLFHVHGLFVACHCMLLNGSAMRFHPKFDAKRAIADFAHSTVFMGVPTLYTRLLADPALTRESVAGMRLFVSGSAPLLAETHAQFEGRTGHRILERYGMTETGMLTSNPLEGERRAGSVGPALPGVSVRVVDDDGKPCPPGAIGHVQVKGPNVFSGYWRMPEKTAEEFTADGYFRTGDVGSLSADKYLTIVGRSKDLIISGGYNVYPKEIELALDELPGVQESAVVGVPHADFGEAVIGVVVPRAGAHPAERELIDALKKRLANFKVPKRVYIVDELPRNAMGKVQKNVLRERFNGAGKAASP
ncbi:MAG TPA: malonyl-CoA synthase [Usitatibacter sp.]|nr:malonyl-CoA synthase [Usitatibacter sp.]